MRFFKLPRPSKHCSECKREFVGYFFSTLLDEAELQRKDLCKGCFLQQEKPPIWWQIPKEEKEKEFIPLNEFETKLYGMFLDSLQNHYVEKTYFLAQYFKRRKIFLSQGESKDYDIFESKATSEVFLVPKMTLKSKQIEELLCKLNSA